jgi:hypothetical protein
LMAASATFALKTGVWFRRVRFVMLSPDPRRSSPPSGRKSTYPPVQIPQATSGHGSKPERTQTLDGGVDQHPFSFQW